MHCHRWDSISRNSRFYWILNWHFPFFSDCADKKAIPFFTHESGAILIKGGTVVNDDKMEVADVIVEDGKIAQVGEDLEVPSGAKIIDATDKFVMPGM